MMYDETITAEYIEVVADKLIKMKWRMKDWSADVYSQVEISLEDGGDTNTDVKVSQTEIPEYDTYQKFVHLDNLENGWR